MSDLGWRSDCFNDLAKRRDSQGNALALKLPRIKEDVGSRMSGWRGDCFNDLAKCRNSQGIAPALKLPLRYPRSDIRDPTSAFYGVFSACAGLFRCL